MSAIVIFAFSLILVAAQFTTARFEDNLERVYRNLHAARAWGMRVRPRLRPKPENQATREQRRRIP